MYCSQCGYLAADDAKFCVQCGTRIPASLIVEASAVIIPEVAPTLATIPTSETVLAQTAAEAPKREPAGPEKASLGKKIFFLVLTVLIGISIVSAIIGTIGLLISACHGQVGPQHVFLLWPLYYGVKWLNRWRRGKAV